MSDVLPPIKCVVVGDKDVGKSSLIVTYYKHEFPLHFGGDNAFGDYKINMSINGDSVLIHVIDTASSDIGLDRFRQFAYGNADVVLICFSLVCRDTFLNVSRFWCSEVRQYCPTIPIMLVGLKKDLRNIQATTLELGVQDTQLLTEEGECKALEIGAVKYVECSALTGEGMKVVFDEAAHAVLHARAKTDKKCILL